MTCCITSSLGVEASRMVPDKMENTLLQCTHQQGSPHTKYIALHSSVACQQLTGSNFLLTWGVNLAHTAEKSAFLWWLDLKSHPSPSCPHFLSLFLFSVPVLSLSFAIFFLFQPPSFFKSLGSTVCIIIPLGATLYCCIVVLLAPVVQRMPPSPAVYHQQQAKKIQSSGEQREEDGGCCF